MTIRIHKELVKRELFSPTSLVFSLCFSLIYLFTSTLLMNFRLLSETFSGPYSLSEKLSIVLSLLKGVGTLYTPGELTLLLVLGLLMGMNLVLISKSFRENKKQGGGVGSLGLGILGVIVSTGCASCGLTALSLIGPSISLTLLPFQTLTLQVVSLILLSVSLIHTLNRRAQGCIIATR